MRQPQNDWAAAELKELYLDSVRRGLDGAHCGPYIAFDDDEEAIKMYKDNGVAAFRAQQ
jgi:mannose/cellobiose epimerase-like protein (N-acyl-D-glucosamine 2-epimerase family)